MYDIRYERSSGDVTIITRDKTVTAFINWNDDKAKHIESTIRDAAKLAGLEVSFSYSSTANTENVSWLGRIKNRICKHLLKVR